MSSVYVFAEKKNGVVVLAMNDYGKVNRAFLDDINNDGQLEVAVEWLEDMGKIGGWIFGPCHRRINYPH